MSAPKEAVEPGRDDADPSVFGEGGGSGDGLHDRVTEDRFLDGRVTVWQPARGYRAGLDAVLLAAALDAPRDAAAQRLLEAGCGAGAALLCAAHRLGNASFVGLERDAAMADLARRGVAGNGMVGHVQIIEGDVADRPAEWENTFDQAFANPPFFEPGAVRLPAEGRRSAYLSDVPLSAWLAFLFHSVRRGGRVTLIHRAAALADLLEWLNRRSGEIEVVPVKPHPEAAAHRVLVRSRKGLKRGPLTLHAGLVLHEAPGGPLTARAASIAAGHALEWR